MVSLDSSLFLHYTFLLVLLTISNLTTNIVLCIATYYWLFHTAKSSMFGTCITTLLHNLIQLSVFFHLVSISRCHICISPTSPSVYLLFPLTNKLSYSTSLFSLPSRFLHLNASRPMLLSLLVCHSITQISQQLFFLWLLFHFLSWPIETK